MPPSDAFTLHPRLAADTIHVKAGLLSDFRLMNDSRFPWLILVPQCPDMVEIGDLSAADRAVLIEETVDAAAALKTVSGCPRTNIAALGNQVPQLHIHVIARTPDDIAWPRPAWGVDGLVPYAPETLAGLAAQLADALP